MRAMYLFCYEAKQPNLKWITQPEQLLGSLLLDITLPVWPHLLVLFTFSEMHSAGFYYN